MGTADHIREATLLAERLGQGARFRRIVESLPNRKVGDFCVAYYVAGGFDPGKSRNDTQKKYYGILKNYL